MKQNPKSSVELSTLSADGSLQAKFARVVATNGENWILKLRNITCLNCDTTHDRDENAAKNIDKVGIGKPRL